MLAAIDDDGGPGPVLRYGRAHSERLSVPLRAVHVCTGQDRMSDADRLLSGVLYDFLPPDQAIAAERQIVHDRDAASALIVLSHEAALVVVAANGGSADRSELVGGCTRVLAGRTACPLAIVRAGARARGGRW